jgi:hypothetical protein
VKIGNRVGVVKVDPGDSFFASTNKFFLELEFYFYDYGTPGFGGTTDVTASGIFGTGSYTQACNYVMRLQTGDASCPLYFGDIGISSIGGSDFIHQAQYWWPYKTTAGVPAWDDAAGTPLNGGFAA